VGILGDLQAETLVPEMIAVCVLPQEKVRCAVMSQPEFPFGGSAEKQHATA